MGCASSRFGGDERELPPDLCQARPELPLHHHHDSGDENDLGTKTIALSHGEGCNIRSENDTDPDRKAAKNGDCAQNDGRRIGRGGRDDSDGAFPGSPSFRVYFQDIRDDNEALKSAISSDEAETTKENKKVMVIKSAKRKKSLKKVLPKGRQLAVKKLFSYKSCYITHPSSGHDHTRLLTAKSDA